MITVRIQVPHSVVQVMSPRMVFGNYVECDPRIKKLRHDQVHGLCTIETSNQTDWATEITWFIIQAQYQTPEEELLAQLSM